MWGLPYWHWAVLRNGKQAATNYMWITHMCELLRHYVTNTARCNDSVMGVADVLVMILCFY